MCVKPQNDMQSFSHKIICLVVKYVSFCVHALRIMCANEKATTAYVCVSASLCVAVQIFVLNAPVYRKFGYSEFSIG